MLEDLAHKQLTIDQLWRSCGGLSALPTAAQRIAFFTPPPPSYQRLNGLAPLCFLDPRRDPGELFADHCGPELLDHFVKVLDFPIRAEARLLEQAAAECLELRRQGLLTSLRGGRPTDLDRPLPPATAERLERCPALVDLIGRIEAALPGTGLFLRSLKFDDPRASSTSPQAEPRSTNLHLDAERSSAHEFVDGIRQFYLNLSPTPRHFLILPVHLRDMTASLEASFGKPEEALKEPVARTLDRFLERFGLAVEATAVAPCSMVAFDGRAFPHDAAKLDQASFDDGRAALELAKEPDLVAALDLIHADYHLGYRPSTAFLEDLKVD